MDNKIVSRDLMVIEQFPTLEDFKASFSKGESDKSVLEKIADAYDKLPIYIKLLKDLDPTGGFISYFADGLLEIKAKRNEEKLWRTLYELLVACRNCCNFVDALYPTTITPRPSINTYYPLSTPH